MPLAQHGPGLLAKIIAGALEYRPELVADSPLHWQRTRVGLGRFGAIELDRRFPDGGFEFLQRRQMTALLQLFSVAAAIGDQFTDVGFGAEEIDHRCGVLFGHGEDEFEAFAID